MARQVLVLDAGMGTRLLGRGLDLRRDDPRLWNLDRPDEVLAAHRLDAGAGSNACLTNTFGANRAWLSRLGRLGDLGASNPACASHSHPRESRGSAP
jgi:5-methyltetrahydrofolate--homocysteine methyltransferase